LADRFACSDHQPTIASEAKQSSCSFPYFASDRHRERSEATFASSIPWRFASLAAIISLPSRAKRSDLHIVDSLMDRFACDDDGSDYEDRFARDNA